MDKLQDNIILGNSLKDWLIAILIIAGLLILLKIIRTVVLVRLKKWAEKTESVIDDFLVQVIEKHVLPFFYLLFIYSGTSYLTFNTKTEHIIKIAFLATSTFFIIRLITALISYSITSYIGSKYQDDKKKQARGIIVILNVVVWILGIIFLIDNLGYDITTLIAGLGIGGIAIALAAQVILKDLFSYFVIFFDKPFELGDSITVDDKSGTVEYIGIKTTRIRAVGGEQLVMSNTDLTDSRVQNLKRMEQRRVVFKLGISYKTSSEKLKKIPDLVSEIIQSQNLTRVDRAHFLSFTDSALSFEFVYFVLSADYNVYMDIQQEINIGIFNSFNQEQIEFAHPTQYIYLDNNTKNQVTSN